MMVNLHDVLFYTEEDKEEGIVHIIHFEYASVYFLRLGKYIQPA